MKFSLSSEQIAQFDRDGFLIVGRLIEDDAVEALRAACERLFRGEFETGTLPDEVNWQEGKSDPSLTRQLCNAWKADRSVASVVLHANLGEAIAKLAGWAGTRIMIDNVIWKPPGTRPLGYHQDSAYLTWYTPSDLVSCWMALDETSAAGGTVEFVRGSHRWARNPPRGEFHGPVDYRKQMMAAAEQEGVEPEIVYIEVPPGGGSFHHGWTWHGSGNNNASYARRSVVLHAMKDSVTYVRNCFQEGTGPVYSRYRRLNDDAIDENHFPILWREDGYRTPGLDSYLINRN